MGFLLLSLTLATHILVRASSRVRPWTRVHSFFLHAQYLYYAFSLKSAFRHPPQPPFLHTSPNSGQSSFPLLHLSGLVRLSAASLKGCTTTLLSIKIHGRGFAPSHEYSASATPPFLSLNGIYDLQLLQNLNSC